MAKKVDRTVCEVCDILDKDITPKMCEYCEVCEAWICLKCKYNLYRRGKAAIIKNTNEF